MKEWWIGNRIVSEKYRCIAICKATKVRCKKAALRGTTRCLSHGGDPDIAYRSELDVAVNEYLQARGYEV